jgi:DNA-binding response OmpR family regulator
MTKPIALVIEDDRDLSTVFAEAMRAAGFECETLFTGMEAGKRLKTPEPVPSLVLLDLHMPGVTGVELVDLIQSQPHMQKTQVIIASADERLAETLQGRDLLFLLKPISFVQLRDLVIRFLPGGQGDT